LTPILANKSQLREVLYRRYLTRFIEDQIYPYDDEAVRNDWKLGSLHREWDNLLQKKKIRILAPRDHLKSFYFSIAYALMRVRFIPDDEIYIFSKTDRQAVKILDKIKRIVKKNPELDFLSKGAGVDFWNKTELRFSNGATIYAQGYQTAVRGAHPRLIILDDPIGSEVVYSDEQNLKAKEKFFQDILPIAEPDTQIIIVGSLQREDDLYHALDPKQYELKTYSAIVDEEKHLTLYPEKWDWEKLMARKREISFDLGEKFFDKEYLNLPVQIVGGLIKKEWLKYYEEKDLPEGDDYIGWDLAVGKNENEGDYAACVVFRLIKDGSYYIRHIYRGRIDFPTRLKKILELASIYRDRKKIQIEENTFQSDTVQLLKKQTSLPIFGIKTTRNKVQRFTEELAPLFENGKVYILPTMKEFESELLTLPRGKHDDMSDAFLIGKSGLGVRVAPRVSWI